MCLSRYIFSVLFWATQRDTFLSIGPGVRRSPGPNSDPPLPMRWRSLAMAVKIRIPQMEDKIGHTVERSNRANQLGLVVFPIIFRVSKTSRGFTKLVIHSIRTFSLLEDLWKNWRHISPTLSLSIPIFTTFYSAFPISQGPSEGFHRFSPLKL